MIRLRPYKRCDAEEIVRWINDERTFLLWGGDHFGEFPINADIINDKYFDSNGDCVEPDNFYPMTALDEKGVFGHFIIRYTGGDSKHLRFGWVVVDGERRGEGLGRQMLTLGLEYAFSIMKADLVTIGVFDINTPAYRCYKSAGFTENKDAPSYNTTLLGENASIVELIITKDEFLK